MTSCLVKYVSLYALNLLQLMSAKGLHIKEFTKHIYYFMLIRIHFISSFTAAEACLNICKEVHDNALMTKQKNIINVSLKCRQKIFKWNTRMYNLKIHSNFTFEMEMQLKAKKKCVFNEIILTNPFKSSTIYWGLFHM